MIVPKSHTAGGNVNPGVQKTLYPSLNIVVPRTAAFAVRGTARKRSGEGSEGTIADLSSTSTSCKRGLAQSEPALRLTCLLQELRFRPERRVSLCANWPLRVILFFFVLRHYAVIRMRQVRKVVDSLDAFIRDKGAAIGQRTSIQK